jgi:Protein of unknown function (DUF3302)
MTTAFEYLCLGILCLGLTMLIYGLVWLHGIPHRIAEANNHPHKRTIHVACWLSVFTLHAIWPLVYLWAIMPRQALGVKVEGAGDANLHARVAELERRLAALQSPKRANSGKSSRK